MNDEVKELVERVRLTDEEIKAKYREFWEELNTEDTVLEEDEDALDVMRKMMEAQLNKFLNDPDLYLQVTGKNPILTIDLGKGDETYCSIDYIPLAEELKEVDSG